MKTRKTMMECLKTYHKKHGGFSTVVKLSEMLWKYVVVTMTIKYTDGTVDETVKRVRVPRSMHTYRLKSARGRWHINRTRGTDEYARMWGTWEIMKDGTVIPRQTFRCLRTFSTLYLLDKARRGIV